MEKRLFLLDSMALIFRAYYALIRSPRITSSGKNTSAQFGFTNSLIELLNNQKPTHIAACFDTEAPTERHITYTDYKANRDAAPEDILEAIPEIKQILRAFNIPIIESDGYEADDIIGTLALQAEKKHFDVFMVTPDKDYGQLVTHKVKIYKPGYQGSGAEVLGIDEVCKKWDIENVRSVIDILALMGDSVDNIPGIKGIGEKTAAKLIKEYKTVEKVIENIPNMKGSIAEKLKSGKEDALLSKQLATIDTNVPVEINLNDLEVQPVNEDALLQVFSELEFKTMAQRVLGKDIAVQQRRDSVAEQPQASGQLDLFAEHNPKKSEQSFEKSTEGRGVANNVSTIPTVEPPSLPVTKNITNTPHQYQLLTSKSDIENLAQKLMQYAEISWDTETTGTDANRAELVGMSFSIEKGTGWYVAFTELNIKEVLKTFEPLFNDTTKHWVGHNIKYDLLMLRWQGIRIRGTLFDTMLADYVIESEGKHGMDYLSEKYLGYEPISIETLIGKKGKGQRNMKDVPLPEATEYATEDADVTYQLKNTLAPLVSEYQVQRVFSEAEMPLVKVLTEMEYEGINIDVPFLHEYSKELDKEAKALERKIYVEAGIEFNIGSPKQLGEVLFERLKIDPGNKKTKTGQWSTGEDVLLKLDNQHTIVHDILEYRQIMKLKSTYVDALPLMINPRSGRVHTHYAQAVAVTGRLSSTNPNLQNIPIRTERGREIRKAFIPRNHEHLLLSADYSQIELRIVAAIADDKNMIQAFRDDKDVHTTTAALIFNVAEADVTKDMRYKAKSVNFGIIYGQSAFGLAQNLNISRTEAKEIIDNYKKEFSSIVDYMDSSIDFAKKHGFVETLLGRKRWVKDINSSNPTVRGYAERNAINSPIQGTAADMIKLAMNHIQAAIEKEKLKAKMLLQVHDELVFDVPKNETEALTKLVKKHMETAMYLPNNVPVKVEVGVGNNWLEAH